MASEGFFNRLHPLLSTLKTIHEADISKINGRMDKLEELPKIAKLDEKLTSANAQIADLQRSMRGEVEGAAIADLSSVVESLKDDLKDCQRSLEDFKDLTSHFPFMTDRLTALQRHANAASLHRKIAQLEHRLQTSELGSFAIDQAHELARATLKSENILKRINKMEPSLKTSQNRIASLETLTKEQQAATSDRNTAE